MEQKYMFIWGSILLNLRVTEQAVDVAMAGVATQSSLVHSSYSPSFVIDGKPNLHNDSQSCTATRSEANPWWRLDMRGPYAVASVEVIRRSDCCIDQINGAEIRIGDSIENNGNNNARCAVITINQISPIMTFNCDQMKGRFVNIYLPGIGKKLQLCEVKVYATALVSGDNIAPRGIAEQSSEPVSIATAPEMAIDEDAGSTCTSVPPEDNPWWRVDLRSIYRITAVSVFSIGDCCSEELNHAEVRIGFREEIDNQRCAVISITEGQSKYTYQCGIMEGRFVYVVLPGLQKTLTFCEIHVYGNVLENVALRGVAFPSSRKWRSAGYASNVIDGKRMTTCSETEDIPEQWVKLDLLIPYSVNIIQLAFKEDCCSVYEVRVDNSSCSIVSSNTQSLVTLDCGGIEGRYVTVIQPTMPLPLCEVEVYSTWEKPMNKVPQRPPPSNHCSSTSCSRDYILIHDQPKTWFEAQTYCRNQFTDLATINNVQDMNKVVNKMGNDFSNFWIGLYEDAVIWKWSLSDEDYYSDDEAEFRKWGEDEPNERITPRCAVIQHTGDWKVLDCSLLNVFLCFDGRDNVSQTKILMETPMMWADARQYCRQYHTDLVSVRNLAENQEIQNMVPPGQLAWIGLFEDSWKWSDGSKSSFRYWLEEQVSSLGSGPNCGQVDAGKWSKKSCNTKSMFLCYYFKKKSLVRIQSDFKMSDPVIQQQILRQLEANMKQKGISDFKIRWRTRERQVSDNK